MKKPLAIITTFLVLMFCLQLAQGWFIQQAQIHAQANGQGIQQLLIAQRAATKRADQVIATVESQLKVILADSGAGWTILCDNILFYEKNPQAANLAKAIIRQNCKGLSLTPKPSGYTGLPSSKGKTG